MGAWPPKAGQPSSRALAYAVAAGLPPQMSYTVAQTAKYTGFDRVQIYSARDKGQLHFLTPVGCSRGARILVDDVDAWLDGMRGEVVS